MEYFLLLVFAIAWWIVRIRDWRERVRQSSDLDARLSELEAKVRSLAAKPAIPTSPETTQQAAYPEAPPAMTRRPDVKPVDVWAQVQEVPEKIPSEHPDPDDRVVINPEIPVTSDRAV